MIVVADSGPLHYLILLDHTELLRRFYRRVAVPDAVAAELMSPGAPDPVRAWMSRAPSWVEVLPVASEAVAAVTDDLDLGERAAIALAEILRADLLLIDEAAGRTEAKRRHLRVTGTLGVLRAGAEQGLVNVPDLVARLQATSPRSIARGPRSAIPNSLAFRRLCPELCLLGGLKQRNFLSISPKANLGKTVALKRAECRSRKCHLLVHLQPAVRWLSGRKRRFANSRTRPDSGLKSSIYGLFLCTSVAGVGCRWTRIGLRPGTVLGTEGVRNL